MVVKESREGIAHHRHFLHQHYLTTSAATFLPLFRPDVRQSVPGLSPKDGSCGSCSLGTSWRGTELRQPPLQQKNRKAACERTAAGLIRALSTAAGDRRVLMILMGCKTEADAKEMLATGGFQE